VRFLLVDRILTLERDTGAVGIKNVTMSEDFLAHHFPERPLMPGTLIIEAMVQLADWVIREGSDFTRIGLATAFTRLRFRRTIRPGDQLRLEVQLLSLSDTTAEVKGRAFRQDELAASGTFTLAIEPLEKYLPAADAKRLFGLLVHGE
jgi:3-hydroxyacyl-[acyl-carrier-protein] dehydratase